MKIEDLAPFNFPQVKARESPHNSQKNHEKNQEKFDSPMWTPFSANAVKSLFINFVHNIVCDFNN